MINIDLLWFLLIPAALTGITIHVLHKLIRGITWGQSTIFSLIGLVISAIIMSTSFYLGKGSKTHDIEIINGEVTDKKRVHGSYERSYSCNCITTCSGSGKDRSCSETCQTCYEDHYTVNWNCHTNIGNFKIAAEDWTSRGVYSLPDPNRYSIIRLGDPVSATHSYTNFIKAVPETLFRPAPLSLKLQFQNILPPYPIGIYDIYHIDRVLSAGVLIPNLREWNDKLSEALKKLGPQKQANAIIVITNTPDTNYFYALQDAWLGAKKNDIVLVIGAPDFPRSATWVRVLALTQDQIFQVKLRDDILALSSLTADNVINALTSETLATFKRKHMHDFAYLEAEIDPPAWVMIVCSIFIFLAYAGFWFYAYKNGDNSFYGRYGNPRLWWNRR